MRFLFLDLVEIAFKMMGKLAAQDIVVRPLSKLGPKDKTFFLAAANVPAPSTKSNKK